eukprot:scaffold311809_cov20-Prasinocladus_malaysianus.AAC.1
MRMRSWPLGRRILKQRRHLIGQCIDIDVTLFTLLVFYQGLKASIGACFGTYSRILKKSYSWRFRKA